MTLEQEYAALQREIAERERHLAKLDRRMAIHARWDQVLDGHVRAADSALDALWDIDTVDREHWHLVKARLDHVRQAREALAAEHDRVDARLAQRGAA